MSHSKVSNIQIIKGTNASDETVSKAMTMLGKTNPEDKVEVSDSITCVGIPEDGLLVVWPDRDAILVPQKEG
jgi:wyosine [tRNA(Phe)-imidazoG37] synthetase (radical SAM superfamily)